MRRLELKTFVDANFSVTERHFGGNSLYTRNTDNGIPDPNFLDAVSNLDSQYIRYPAGQPDVAYADGVIIEGYLPDHLVNFLESARTNHLKVLIVTPTHEAYPGAETIGEFARLIAQDYSDVLHAFEIGNEYWNHQTETSYGQVANDSVLEIADALQDAGVNKPIWVQMGDAAGWESEFHSRNDERGWVTRTIEANRAVIDQISEEAFLEIDGVVEHFYLRGGEQYVNIAAPNDQMIGLDFSIWKNYLVDDATLNITEWNVRSSNLDQLGMRAASSLIAHFSHIMDLGVDEAYLWPPHLNTSSDLAGSGRVILDQATGIVINSVGGAIFDMMSTSLPGLEYLPSGVAGESPHAIHHLYGNDERVVVYVSSRSEVIETVSYSLGSYFEGFELTSAVRVGYDPSTSDGRHYNYRTNSWDDSQVITVLGEDYVINEHDVRASIEVLDHSSSNSLDGYVFELLPYQVVELTFKIPLHNLIDGTSASDTLSGTLADDLMYLHEGNDSVTSAEGADTVFGGAGDDYINSGIGDDFVDGGHGDDSLRGWGGDDTLFGGLGKDNLQGSYGRDSLVGGSGDDSLFGGDWHDTLAGGAGEDHLWGQNGNDLIIAGEGQDTINGGEGKDTLSLAEASEGVSVWAAEGIAEIGTDQVAYKEMEAIEGTGFSDHFSVKGDKIEFVGLGGDDYFNVLVGQANSIDAGAGNDTIFVFGGERNDIFGGVGNDKFLSYGSRNTYTGGRGDDEFHFFGGGVNSVTYQVGDGNDVIHGLELFVDRIYIEREAKFGLSVQEQSGSTLLNYQGGGSILLVGVTGFDIDDNIIWL